MTKCECGRLFNWWDKIVGTYTEHRIMCEALKVFKEERDEYRDRLREANLKIMRLEDRDPTIVNVIRYDKVPSLADPFGTARPVVEEGQPYWSILPKTFSHDCRGPV